MPVLHCLGGGPSRFSQIGRLYETLTDRALSAALRELRETKLIGRRVVDGNPPATQYHASTAGQSLALVLAEL